MNLCVSVLCAVAVLEDDAHALDATDVQSQTVRIRVAESLPSIDVTLASPATVTNADTRAKLPAGRYTIRVRNAQPAKQRFHLFAKTFYPHQLAEETAYLAEARARGFDPEVVVVGKRFTTSQGTELDNRVGWVSIARYPTQAEAEAARKQLERQEQWSWMYAETTAPGTGEIAIVDVDGDSAVLNAPVTFAGSTITLESGKRPVYAGALELRVGPDAKLEIAESVPVDDYLRGVLPSEMPTSWPIEALKAQAVSARSEVLAHMAGKHQLEGVDFCGEVHCRAYRGSANGDPNTDRAIAETHGEILLQGNRVAATVFSSNCGGWTENNDNVWSGPPDAALRGIDDTVNSSKNPAALGWSQWLAKPAAAWCQGDAEGFRWRRSYTVDELSAIVNKRHDVGRIRAIEEGERGVSGRLKSVRIVGAKRTETIYKELPIRQAFGNLPSAMFVVHTGSGNVTFVGGGRGHGVGLCQHGARGMADGGMSYQAILTHYFSGVRIERFHE